MSSVDALGLAINLLYVSTTKLCFLPELDCCFDFVFDFDDFLLLIDFLRVLALLGRYVPFNLRALSGSVYVPPLWQWYGFDPA